MASFTIAQYLGSLYPNLSTMLPGYNPATAINGAMALYWSYLFPDTITKWQAVPTPDTAPPDPGNPLDTDYLTESVLTERQKWMIALRVAITLAPVLNTWLASPQVMEAQAGPAMVKFQDLSKLLRVVLPLWQTDLNNVEGAEDIYFNLLPNVPAYLLKMSDVYPVLGETRDYIGTPVVQSGAFFENGEGGQTYLDGLLLG